MISEVNIKVKRDLCYACGVCVERCIMDNLRLSLAPCRQACPIDMNCQGYVRLIAQDREKEAAEELRRYTPFGAVLGRVCSHPCEAVCERRDIDGPVHIRALKRYLADSYPEISWRASLLTRETGRSVAIVGSGPAGLTAAYELRHQGHQVTVFESALEPGGLLRYGIPSFRLPEDTLNRTVVTLEEMGVSFQTGKDVGRDLELDRLENEADAVILAMGAGLPKKLDLPGMSLSRTLQGLDLLRRVREGNPPSLGRSAIIIGGGNSAVDAALTCRRLGVAEVRMVCLEDRSQMPAFALELEEAQEEGVVIDHCWGPTRVVPKENGQMEIEFSRCLSLLDDQGCFNPALEQACGLRLSSDSIVVAVGQEVKANGLPESLLDPSTKRLAADPATRQSLLRRKMFACGDCHSGAGSVVEAMASGREAAISVDRFLRGEGLHWGRGNGDGSIKEYEVDRSRAKGGKRGKLTRLAVEDRTLHLEVERILSSDKARGEAERCLSCGRAAEVNRTCWYCLPCEIECPVKALEVRMPYLVR
jgi:NADPH-dependent glutamate synthase beta subunit-like oxidoreductase